MARFTGVVALSILLLCGMQSAQAQMGNDEEANSKPPKKLPSQLGITKETSPILVRIMMQPLRHGMFVHLPVIDTDPNRGVTVGIMPIWVLQDETDGRIREIHAPSLTYNTIFGPIPTYRYYYYPTDKSAVNALVSVSKKEDREVMGEFEDMDFLGRGMAFAGRLHYNVDGSQRFFGIGPNTPKSRETNYTDKMFYYKARLGLPFFEGSGWKFNLGHQLAGHRLAAGVINALPNTVEVFPDQVPNHWHQSSEFQMFVDYDTRDSPITTTSGSYAKFYLGSSQEAFGSEYSFQRYGVDLRRFIPSDPTCRRVTAGNVRYEQLAGDAPFYLLPQLGGKSIFRAYGTGRYVDKGIFAANAEERFKVYEVPLAGVKTEFEVAPFIGMGTAFDSPHRIAWLYMRPVAGTALRAIARPQVVGSVDFGVGQEGLAAFIDINYSF